MAAALTALPGCDGESPVAPTLPEGDVPWETLYAAQTSGIAEFRRDVIRVDPAFQTLWDELVTMEETPPVDFNTDMVVVVASGEQPRSCYAIEVTGAVSDGTDLTLTVTETVPNPACLCAEEVVQPAEVIRLPRANLVTFGTVTEEASCSS